MARILDSPFVHVDETRLSIRGTDQYVWVFTNGSQVVFRLTETRESEMVKDVLANFGGVLVSDFYAGYDAVPCSQQKCLVHLIRDMNSDLWHNPYNTTFESFACDFKDLLVSVFEDVGRYGLKKRHLRKFQRPVDRFFKERVADESYECEVTEKYRKRFQRYRPALFRFLEEDGIPWNNNAAERAIRHLAIQRKISGHFSPQVAIEYLRMLSIAQTCRFQEKSFLKFLLSGEKDVDAFKRSRPPKTSRPVSPSNKESS